jgi:hypothetical protein
MRATLKENIGKAFSKFIGDAGYNLKSPLKIIAVCQDTNASQIASLFNTEICLFDKFILSADTKELSDSKLETYDIVICDISFEEIFNNLHFFKWTLSLLNMDGYFFLATHNQESSNIIFNLEQIGFMAQENQSRVIESWIEKKGTTKEVYSIIRKTEHPIGWDGNHELDIRLSSLDIPTHLNGPISRASDQEEKTYGQLDYLSFFIFIHDHLSPKNYLEIGIRHGRSLAQAKCQAIGIDPSPDIKVQLENTTIYRNTSDFFFDHIASTHISNDRDLIFIDGMHLFEYALRDFINCELYSHKNTLIIIDDIFPCHPTQALRKRASQVWTGDIWKIIPCFKEFRPDLAMIAIDTSPTGLLLIINLDSANSILSKKYNNIIESYVYSQALEPPEYILNRKNAISPSNNNLKSLLNLLHEGDINSISAQKIINDIRL